MKTEKRYLKMNSLNEVVSEHMNLTQEVIKKLKIESSFSTFLFGLSMFNAMFALFYLYIRQILNEN